MKCLHFIVRTVNAVWGLEMGPGNPHPHIDDLKSCSSHMVNLHEALFSLGGKPSLCLLVCGNDVMCLTWCLLHDFQQNEMKVQSAAVWCVTWKWSYAILHYLVHLNFNLVGQSCGLWEVSVWLVVAKSWQLWWLCGFYLQKTAGNINFLRSGSCDVLLITHFLTGNVIW